MGSLVSKITYICLWVGSPSRPFSLNAKYCIAMYLCNDQFRVWSFSFDFWWCSLQYTWNPVNLQVLYMGNLNMGKCAKIEQMFDNYLYINTVICTIISTYNSVYVHFKMTFDNSFIRPKKSSLIPSLLPTHMHIPLPHTFGWVMCPFLYFSAQYIL